MNNNHTNSKVDVIKLYEIYTKEYTLVLRSEYSAIAHVFGYTKTPNVLEYQMTYMYSDTLEIEQNYHSQLIDTRNFKYIEALERYCYLGVTNLLFNDNHNVLIQKGLAIVVQILLNNNITDEQVAVLNDSYKKIIKLKNNRG